MFFVPADSLSLYSTVKMKLWMENTSKNMWFYLILCDKPLRLLQASRDSALRKRIRRLRRQPQWLQQRAIHPLLLVNQLLRPQSVPAAPSSPVIESMCLEPDCDTSPRPQSVPVAPVSPVSVLVDAEEGEWSQSVTPPAAPVSPVSVRANEDSEPEDSQVTLTGSLLL